MRCPLVDVLIGQKCTATRSALVTTLKFKITATDRSVEGLVRLCLAAGLLLFCITWFGFLFCMSYIADQCLTDRDSSADHDHAAHQLAFL